MHGQTVCYMHGGGSRRKGGAPKGSKNALKTGQYETILASTMTPEEFSYRDSLDINPLTTLRETLKTLRMRELRDQEGDGRRGDCRNAHRKAEHGRVETAKGFCRSSNPQAPKLIRCTVNPLGVGHLWVKRYFIDPAPSFTPITDAAGSKRVFIPATIYDNKHLIEADPKYLLRLESITDDNLRRAWLNGDWNIVAGAFFGDVWSPNRNVIRPFAVPKGWYCFRSADGTAAPDGVFYPRGALIRFAEWYGAKRDSAGRVVPNEGLRMSSREVAKGIVKREKMGIAIHPGPPRHATSTSRTTSTRNSRITPSTKPAMQPCSKSAKSSSEARTDKERQ